MRERNKSSLVVCLASSTVLERLIMCCARLGFKKNDNLVKYSEVLQRPSVGLGAAALW